MFQDFNAQAPTAEVEPDASPATVVASVVQRYPELSQTEFARLIDLYRQLSAVDVALLISDAEVGPKFEALLREHRAKFRTPFRHYAVLVWMAVVGIATIAWAMASAS